MLVAGCGWLCSDGEISFFNTASAVYFAIKVLGTVFTWEHSRNCAILNLDNSRWNVEFFLIFCALFFKVFVDEFHNVIPERKGRVYGISAESLVVIVAEPTSSNVFGGKSYEISVAVIVGRTCFCCNLY